MTRRGIGLFAAMSLIWGLPYLLIKVAVDDLGPVTLVFCRTAIGTAILLPVALSRQQIRPLLTAWRTVVVYTVIEVGVPWLLLSDAERHISSSLAGLLVAAVPLVGAVLVRIVGGAEPLHRSQLIGLAVGLTGVAAILGFDVGGGSIGAIAEVGVITVCYAVGPMIIARRLSHLPSTGVVAASMTLTALIYAPWTLTHLPATAPGGRVVLAVAALGVVCTALAFIVFFALIAEVGPVRATVITYLNPAVAVALGVLVLGERVTLPIALGFGLILAGSAFATGALPRRARAAPVLSTPVPEGAIVGAAEGRNRDVSEVPTAVRR